MRRIARGSLVSFVLMLALGTALAGEGRTPVYQLGTVISAPGKYILTRNLVGNIGGPVIEITAQDVDLDLNGFLIHNFGTVGILVNSDGDVRIRNGEIRDADVGIEIVAAGAPRAVLEDLRIGHPLTAGIRIVGVNAVAIRRVMVDQSGGDAIRVLGTNLTTGRIESSQVQFGAGSGISIENVNSFSVVDNQVDNFTFEGIRIEQCTGCLVKENTITQCSTLGLGSIFAVGTRGLTIVKNVVSDSASHGIHVGNATQDAFILENMVNRSGNVATPGDGIRVSTLRAVIQGNVSNENFGVGLHILGSRCTFGRNSARFNANLAGAACAGAPALFLPDSCNAGVGNTSFGDNLIPGPPVF